MRPILPVEGHQVLADTPVRVLQKKGNFHVWVVAETAEEALVRPPEPQVDLALVDVVLLHTRGIKLFSIIHRNTSQKVKRSLAAGAPGYVLKDEIQEVLRGVQHVLQGERF